MNVQTYVNDASFITPAPQAPAGGYVPLAKGIAKPSMPSNYGFGAQQSLERGALLVTRAAADGSNNETTQDDSNKDVSDIEVSSSEIKKAEGKAEFKPLYAFFVLFVALLCRIMVQWHRKGLTYAYGYTGLGEAAGNPIYEISAAYPELKGWYGLLAGLIYTVPYSFFGLLVGKFADNANRKLWLGIMVILASLTIGISGFVNSFAVLALMRVFHGMFNSATNPLSFSLVSDYFPPDKRSTANSIIQAGNYIGVGVSSLSIILISQFGWRACYGVMAAAGVLGGLLSMLFVKEPERGQFLTAE